MHPEAYPSPPTPTPDPNLTNLQVAAPAKASCARTASTLWSDLAPVPAPPVVPCPGLACLACGNPVGSQRLHRTAWAWAHLGVRPVGCPGLLVPAADLVYLVHLLPAYRHARHYLGFAEGGRLPRRLREHATSDHQGARLLRVALAAGGDLTRLWVGSRKLERQLKQHKAVPRLLCPACPTPPRGRPGSPGIPILLGGGG
jgi:hypothetical protein